MATELPEEPKSRKEQYLADIAGQEVTLPDEPKSREEQYLAYIAENGGGGGGGGTSNFNQLSNRPKYNGTTMTGDTNIPEVKTYTAGSNITISGGQISATDTTYTAGTGLDLNGTSFSVDYTDTQAKLTAGSNITIDGDNVISATDTTYSDFTGTDGTAAGAAGLVPAPTTTDAGKFLKADGTWDTAGGGSGPTVVQTTGTSTTDVMSQNAVTSMVYADASTKNQVRIGDGSGSSGTNAIAIGKNSVSAGVASVAAGSSSIATARGSVAVGVGSSATTQGQFDISTTNTSGNGYNNSNYRLLTGLYDGQSAHDAATKGQLDSIAIKNAGAPTTATVGTVGQLLEDTTNGKLYICTDTTGGTYTWVEVGAGGSGPTVVQTTGTSTTDVMSQNAATSMVYADPSTKERVRIGSGAEAGVQSTVAIGKSATASGGTSLAIGLNSTALYTRAMAIGAYSSATATMAVAAAPNSQATVQGQFDISTGTYTTGGYNSSNYRLLTGLYDPQSAHDAATKGYVDGTTETYTIATADWSALSSSSPYTYQATVTATYTIGANTIAELLNDNPVDFATYGFAIGSISSQSVTIYSIGQPSASVSLKINYKG